MAAESVMDKASAAAAAVPKLRRFMVLRVPETGWLPGAHMGRSRADSSEWIQAPAPQQRGRSKAAIRSNTPLVVRFAQKFRGACRLFAQTAVRWAPGPA